ncbi:MAG: hypothetical protein PHH98_02365 [Candidatus Gracilibacteria bacterium]|nr:hypothetical protein [Candidatus Gracilibacteria bacterium]
MNFTHITDVGATQGCGSDSLLRIQKQYEYLNMNTQVIPAGHSPLHVAFTACSELDIKAHNNAKKVMEIFKKNPGEIKSYALNSAPRNEKKSQENGKENHIFRLTSSFGRVFLIYGLDVLSWVCEFEGKENVTIQKLLSLGDIIPDTSSGSQFRSAEHLPIVHFLESRGDILSHVQYEDMSVSDLESMMKVTQDLNFIIAPPDEFGNGRIILSKKVLDEILTHKKVKLGGDIDKTCVVQKSLTLVEPGELSIWPSSNHFHNSQIVVANVGTRWKNGTTKTTDKDVVDLSKKLQKLVGQSGEIILK